MDDLEPSREQDEPGTLPSRAQVPKESHLAIEWYTRAAAQGHVGAMRSLAAVFK